MYIFAGKVVSVDENGALLRDEAGVEVHTPRASGYSVGQIVQVSLPWKPVRATKFRGWPKVIFWALVLAATLCLIRYLHS